MEKIPFTYEQRLLVQRTEKNFIGRYIATYLREKWTGRIIAIDGGTSNFSVVNHLLDDLLNPEKRHRSVSQVLTNNLEILGLASNFKVEDMRILWRSTGGLLRPETRTLLPRTLRDVGVNWAAAVVGANCFQPPNDVCTNTRYEQEVKRAMCEGATNSVIFPVDSSKWSMQGEFFMTLDEIVKHFRKDATIVTCFPFREKQETGRQYRERLTAFLAGCIQVIKYWGADLETYLAPMNLSEGSVESGGDEQRFGCEANERRNDLMAMLQAAFGSCVSPGQEADRGLVVRFHLPSTREE